MAELVYSYKKEPPFRMIGVPCLVTASDDCYEQASNPEPEDFFMTAFWDTGATGCAISKGLIDFLGIQPTGELETFIGANGTYESETYRVNIHLSDKIVFKNILVSEMKRDTRICCIIGLEVIAKSDFVIEPNDDTILLKFRYPGEGHQCFESTPVHLQTNTCIEIRNKKKE